MKTQRTAAEIIREKIRRRARKLFAMKLNHFEKWYNPTIPEILEEVYTQYPEVKVHAATCGIEANIRKNISSIREASFRHFNKQPSVQKVLEMVSSSHKLNNLKYHRYGLINANYYAKENQNITSLESRTLIPIERKDFFKDPTDRDSAKLFLAGLGKPTEGFHIFERFPGREDKMALAMISFNSTAGGVKIHRDGDLLMYLMLSEHVNDPDVFQTLWEMGNVTGTDYRPFRELAIQVQEMRAEERRKAEESAKEDDADEQDEQDAG